MALSVLLVLWTLVVWTAGFVWFSDTAWFPHDAGITVFCFGAVYIAGAMGCFSATTPTMAGEPVTA